MLKPIRVILLLSAIFIYFLAPAQLFNRTEDRIGLQDLRDNNGVSVADYDGDNDLDLFVVSIYEDTDEDPLTFSKLFRNNNDGTFTDVTEESGLVDLMPKGELGAFNFKGLAGRKYGASWADYDNDGHVDIFFTHLATLQLFRNMGDGTFQNVTEQTGIPERNNCGNTGATWFDYNNDSYLDVYISDWKECPYNSMYRNNGDGTFTDVSDIITDFDAEFYANYMSIPFDFNKDGFMDLYVSTDLFDPNQLFINQNGTSFTEEGADYGVDVSQDDMGVAIADLNQDSHFDIAVTSIDRNYLLVDDGDANFSDETAFNKVEETGWAWGVTFGDFDLDGDEDLFIVNGFDIGNRGPETNVFYDSRYMQEDNSFEILEAGLEDFGISVEGLHFDYDNDGDLDLIVTNSDRTTMFYDNQTIIDPQNPDGLLWFKVSLEGTTSNRSAIGTIVEVNTTLGDYYRYFSGVGFLGQSIQPVHFGLETGAAIESVQITWPSGLVEVHNGIDVNTHIKATEGSGFEVLPQNYAEKAQGCIDPDSCNYDPDAILDDGSCEYLDVPQTITGAAVTGYFKQETYGFPLQPGQTISWGVEGGEIVSGHISQEVIVRWSLEEQGRVFAVIRDENCASEEVSLNVTVTISQIEENISVARIWNEALLYAIRNDFARPTVHARNLFHTSAAMYDVWAIYNSTHPYLIGNELNGYSNGFEPFNTGQATADDIDEAISFAAYRLLVHRFQNSPNAATTRQKFNDLMNQLGYSTGLSGLNYASGDPAQLGNFVAQSYIDYGLQDGSRESSDYDNAYYQPVNEALAPTIQGNTTISDPNRWQPLSLDTFIDQSGNLIPGETIDFLSPEWGNVYPFSMTDGNTIVYNRSGNNYTVFNDPGAPPYVGGQGDEAYKWGFSLVSIWSAHLDPNDGIMWDISPNSIGNMSSADFPLNYTTLPQFFDVFDGGVNSQGYSSNPVTGQPYEEQIVPRGDYTRVLAEFWADGPDSETPPGHWFTILNTVNDHPDLTRQFNGQGEPLEPLEWDVKAYFTLGGAMHDSAISAWSVKGWYDYIRPISAIRYMTELGQSSDPALPNYHPNGIPLVPGYVELIEVGDPLEGRDENNVGEIKVKAWRGHTFIDDIEIDQAGVDWILASRWWPYQRPSFVTPPFAGYVSGHSTYSRAAAEVLTLLTGSEYFPGGMGAFLARKNEFLVFEQGPSVDVVLQWASYRDASDQCSLSRIWGGIHPPVDDIPGRLIGEQVGQDAFDFAEQYFAEVETPIDPEDPIDPTDPEDGPMIVYPNPIQSTVGEIVVVNSKEEYEFLLFNIEGEPVAIEQTFTGIDNSTRIQVSNLAPGTYILISGDKQWKLIII